MEINFGKGKVALTCAQRGGEVLLIIENGKELPSRPAGVAVPEADLNKATVLVFNSIESLDLMIAQYQHMKRSLVEKSTDDANNMG